MANRRPKPKDAYLQQMRQNERLVMSPLTAHLNHYRETDEGAAMADELELILHDTFTSESGLKALLLFEKAVLLAGVPNGASEGALREMNAVRNFVHDIRRIVSNG